MHTRHTHTIRDNEPLARHTSWRIGGPARYYSEVQSIAALQDVVGWAAERDVPVFVLGGGTNLLVADSGFAGLVVRYTDKTWQIHPQPELARALLSVGAGAPMAGTARRVAAQGWGGLEWAEGLPGTVGGAVYGNAGCYGGDIAGVLQRVTLLTGQPAKPEVAIWTANQLHYTYRSSRLKTWESNVSGSLCPIVLLAELALARTDPATLAARMKEIAAMRKSKTPWGSTCGSVFKNPPPAADGTARSAGQLIDRAGLKGARHGGAEISSIHANYIVNRGGATAADVWALIDLARRTVAQECGIELELEIQLLGDWS